MKKYRGWVIALLLILLCIGGVRLVLRATAADKMMKVLEAEAAAGHKAQLSP